MREKFLECAKQALDADEARETLATLEALPDASVTLLLNRS